MSTPIETNTEQLQEVLQQVYNLPSRSGGSSEPDLVIGLNVVNPKLEGFEYADAQNSDFSVLSGSVSNVIEKIKNGNKPIVLLKEIQVYWTNSWSLAIAEAQYVAALNSEEYPSDEYHTIKVRFSGVNLPSYTRDAREYDCIYDIHIALNADTSTVRKVVITRYEQIAVAGNE